MRNLPQDALRRVHQRITRLRERPLAPGTRKLAGGLGYRVRVGEYRVLFFLDDETRTVVVTAVRHRREAYR
ncbi:MAG: type II toxin-antitoxin system RelE/ParE family toxin [Chloroflexi bacterium]|nr:type II toxin-antitoxin system RelE/ParE family toxin [Chloroflexota bacterium]